jgi:hypothetical protein
VIIAAVKMKVKLSSSNLILISGLKEELRLKRQKKSPD